MAGSSRTTLGDLIIRMYSEERIAVQQYEDTVLWDAMATWPEPIGGADFRFPVGTSHDESGGYGPEGSAIPASNNEEVEQAVITPKFYRAMVEFSGLAKDTSGSDMAFANALTYSIDEKIKRALVYTDGSLSRDGTGLLARINDASISDTTANDLAVDSPSAVFLRPNMNIDFFDATNNTIVAKGKISQADHVSDIIRLTTDLSASLSDNDRLFLQGTQTSGVSSLASNELSGLQALIKTSGDFLGITISDHPTLEGNVVDASSVALTEDLMQRAQNQIELRGGMGVVGSEYVWFMSPVQQRQYAKLTVPQTRFTGMTKDLGYGALEHNGHRFLVSPQAIETEVYLMDPKQFYKCFTPNGSLRVSTDYGNPWLNRTDFDQGYCIIRMYAETALRHPNRFVRIESLTTPTK